jgi:hypothetical protein
MAVTLYTSADASAPQLSGTAGSLTTLLDAILVNGYGSKAAAGWTIAFSGTNQRDYKQGTGSNGYYLDVNDNAPATATEARMRGYETMSALGTGTQPFPTTAQSSFGVTCRKSATSNSTARNWYCIADATCFYLFVDTTDNPGYSFTFMFGDIFSYKSGDTYNTLIIGRDVDNNSATNADHLGHIGHGNTSPLINGLGGHYIDRVWTGTGGSLPCTKFSSFACGGSTACVGSSAALVSYPNGPDAALELSPIWVAHGGAVRGYLKGAWAPLHYQPCGHGDQFSGTGNMSGKSFMAFNVQGSNVTGQIIMETSNTWS